MNKSQELALLITLALFALVAVLGASSKGLWLDESYTIHRSGIPIERVVRINRLVEGNPTFYYVVMHYWLKIGRSALVLRSLSILSGLACLALIYRIGLLLADRRVGLLAAMLLALSSVQVYFAQEARPYMLGLALTLGAGLICLRLVLGPGPPRRRDWAGWLVLSCLSTYTLYYAWFAIAAQILFVGLVCWRTPERRAQLGRILRNFLLLAGSLLLLWIPELVALLGKVESLEIELGAKKIIAGIPYPPEAVAAHWVSFYNHYLPFTAGFHWGNLESKGIAVLLLGLAVLLIGAYCLALVMRYRGGDRNAALAAGAMTIAPWVMLALLPFKPHRFEFKHLLITLPWFCLGLALLSRERRTLAALPLALFIGFNGWSNYRGLLLEEKEHWAQVSQTLQAQAAPGDLVLIKPAYTRIPLRYATLNAASQLRELYATDSTDPAVLVFAPEGAAPYDRHPRSRRYRPYLLQGARRKQVIWLIVTWSNVADPRPRILGELKALGYRRDDSLTQLLPGFAGSNATLIQLTCYRLSR